MYYVYLLKYLNNKIYFGYNSGLKRRLNEYLNSKVYTTKRMKKINLFYDEAFLDQELAKEREEN